MKKILIIGILFALFGCQKTLEDKSMISSDLVENWCIDYPVYLSNVQAGNQYNFEFEGDFYFFTFPGSSNLKIFKLNKKEKVIKNVSILNPPAFGIKDVTDIKQFNNLVLIVGGYHSVYLYDLKTNMIVQDSLLNDDSNILSATIFENNLYLMQAENNFKTHSLTRINLSTYKKESLMNLSIEDIGSFEINKTKAGDLLLTSFSSLAFVTINLSNQKKVISRLDFDKNGHMRTFESKDDLVFGAGASLVRYNPTSSQIVWSKLLDQVPNFPSNILIEAKSVFLATHKGVLSRYDAENGTLLWSSEKMPDGFYHIEFMNEFIYMSDGKKLYVLQSSDGKSVIRQIDNFQIGYPWFFDKTNKLLYSPKNGRFCEHQGL